MRTIENGRLFNILQVIIGCLISLIYNKTIKCRLEIIYIEKTSSFWSIAGYVRSPMSPHSVMYEELSSPPVIDFTGYRHLETILLVAGRD